jgi:hypothetical protein
MNATLVVQLSEITIAMEWHDIELISDTYGKRDVNMCILISFV